MATERPLPQGTSFSLRFVAPNRLRVLVASDDREIALWHAKGIAHRAGFTQPDLEHGPAATLLPSPRPAGLRGRQRPVASRVMSSACSGAPKTAPGSTASR